MGVPLEELKKLEETLSSRGNFLRSLKKVIGNKITVFNKPVILEKAKQK